MKDFAKTLLWFSALVGVPPRRLFAAGLALVAFIALLVWALVESA